MDVLNIAQQEVRYLVVADDDEGRLILDCIPISLQIAVRGNDTPNSAKHAKPTPESDSPPPVPGVQHAVPHVAQQQPHVAWCPWCNALHEQLQATWHAQQSAAVSPHNNRHAYTSA